ncbi:MAG: NAD(P)/FAD-dependent oxidoreductase [bacterium]
MTQSTHKHQVLIVGGGTAGISVASRLLMLLDQPDIAIIEPAEWHYYQPMWTLSGGGVVPKESTRRSMSSIMPNGVKWIRDAVETFDPEQNQLTTAQGNTLSYDVLIVCPGIQIDWDKIPGLREAIGNGKVCSNYDYNTVDSTWDAVRQFPKGGTAIFTMPTAPVKCPGAPQKALYLSEDYLRKNGTREGSRVIFATAKPNLFGIEKYRLGLERVAQRKNIECAYEHELVEVRGAQDEAVFKNLKTEEEVVMKYDLLHAVPPMSAPDFIKKSPLADSSPFGWVDVDPFTLRHRKFGNVFALGDASSAPTSKTGAAIRKQYPVVASNVAAVLKKRMVMEHYNGYASCPLVTDYGKVLMAEFDYDGIPQETFGAVVDQGRELSSMWMVKRWVLPWLYWNIMLTGKG